MFHPHDDKITLKFNHYDTDKLPFIVFKISYSDNDISLFLTKETLISFLNSMSECYFEEINKNKEILAEIQSDKKDDEVWI